MVVLATRTWDWPELCEVGIGDARGSRVFPYDGAAPLPLVGLWPGCLTRWNGLPGTVTVGSLEGPGLANAERLLWVRDPRTPVVAEVPVSGGQGKLLFSQLDVQDRLDRKQPDYDPVAERVLINLLQGE